MMSFSQNTEEGHNTMSVSEAQAIPRLFRNATNDVFIFAMFCEFQTPGQQ